MFLLCTRYRTNRRSVLSLAARMGGGGLFHAAQTCPVHAAALEENGLWAMVKGESVHTAKNSMCHIMLRRIWRFRGFFTNWGHRRPGCLCKVSSSIGSFKDSLVKMPELMLPVPSWSAILAENCAALNAGPDWSVPAQANAA